MRFPPCPLACQEIQFSLAISNPGSTAGGCRWFQGIPGKTGHGKQKKCGVSELREQIFLKIWEGGVLLELWLGLVVLWPFTCTDSWWESGPWECGSWAAPLPKKEFFGKNTDFMCEFGSLCCWTSWKIQDIGVKLISQALFCLLLRQHIPWSPQSSRAPPAAALPARSTPSRFVSRWFYGIPSRFSHHY